MIFSIVANGLSRYLFSKNKNKQLKHHWFGGRPSIGQTSIQSADRSCGIGMSTCTVLSDSVQLVKSWTSARSASWSAIDNAIRIEHTINMDYGALPLI